MISNRKALRTIRLAADVLLIGISFIASLYLLSYNLPNLLKYTDTHLIIGVLTIVWFYSSRITNLYEDFRTKNFSFELIQTIKNVITQVITCVILLFMLKEFDQSRLLVVYFGVLLFILVSVEKFCYRAIIKELRKQGRNTGSLLIIGGGDVGINFYNSIIDNKAAGYQIIGVLDDKEISYFGERYLGTIDSLDHVLTHNLIDEIIICLPNYASERLSYVIDVCRNYATRVKIVPDYFKFLSEKYEVDMLDRYTIISLKKETINELHWRILKRTFDIIFTLLVFLLLFSWLWPLLAILQIILNPGPVFYKAERWGRGGESFLCYKFRSMKPAVSGESHKITNKDDSRITTFGKLLRKFSLDELPQFINVLKGDMSIVGPRPHDVQENIDLKDKITSYMWRHLVKPGLTGWAQVNGFRGGTKNIYLMKKRTECDLWYVENWSFWLDIQIILLTIWRTIKGDSNAY